MAANSSTQESLNNISDEKQLSSENYEVLNNQNLVRMQASIPMEDPDEKITPEDDLLIVDMMRKLKTNNSQVKGWMLQLVLNGIGIGQKPKFKSKNKDFNEQAGELYKYKSKKWEGRDNKNRFICNELILKTAFAEGQIFAYYDASGIMNKGRFFYWTREYMPMINKSDFKQHIDKIKEIVGAKEEDELKQVKGIITNQHGITKGYIVCSAPGIGESKYDPDGNHKITILPANRNAKLIKFTDEINAKHGLSMLIALAEDVNDVKRILKAYIKKAEIQAKIAMIFKVKDALKKQASRSANIAANKGREPGDESTRLKNFEKLSVEINALVEYLEKDEEVEFRSLMAGESKEVENILNTVSVQAGYGLGFSRMHTTGSSDKASFAGLMAESMMSSKTFEHLQKAFIEREIYDFELEAVIKDAMEKGDLPKVDDWYKVKWAGFPKIESLNPLQAAKAIKEKIKAGLLSPEEVRADIEDVYKELSEFKKAAQEYGLKLDIFEEGEDSEEVPTLPSSGDPGEPK